MMVPDLTALWNNDSKRTNSAEAPMARSAMSATFMLGMRLDNLK